MLLNKLMLLTILHLDSMRREKLCQGRQCQQIGKGILEGILFPGEVGVLIWCDIATSHRKAMADFVHTIQAMETMSSPQDIKIRAIQFQKNVVSAA